MVNGGSGTTTLKITTGGTATLNASDSHLIVDLTSVDFLDSTGLGVLVGGLKRFREHGGSLALVVTKSGVLKVLQVTGLTGVLQARSSVPDVIDADPHWRQAAEGEAGSAVAWCKQHDLA